MTEPIASGAASRGCVITFHQVSYGVDGQRLLGPLDLRITEHRTAIIGANGSGKSTLLRLINGLLLPTEGRVGIDGLDTKKDGRRIRGRTGFLFQNPDAQIVMPSALEDVAFGLKGREPSAQQRDARARAALAEVGLNALADRPAHALSGGEKQRLALAGALVLQPDLLIMDEPTAMLDLPGRLRFDQLLTQLAQQVILTTHSLTLARQCDRVVWIQASDTGAEIAGDGAAAAVTDAYEVWCRSRNSADSR